MKCIVQIFSLIMCLQPTTDLKLFLLGSHFAIVEGLQFAQSSYQNIRSLGFKDLTV